MTAEQNDAVPPRASLRAQIVLRGTLRSLVIAALLCAVSYYHVAGMLEDDLLEQLELYIGERGLRDLNRRYSSPAAPR